ncbi:MAG TPA: tRNA adenosine(34) deaminase TadA [bacterium]|jgi:tRNA(adenine34) deaminase|nr:tRNA adenosine(34) deaminase TadA [bacterium]HNT64622.1 tRNA adenosine(34) deaminase TadA [bacterium]HOX85782.1 tRNA adenosine(34) deaminase TadA [bacterium]HPG45235.1 tRNA adenosine(34) deaminase TadA [bacterium]HPM97477.1 tRNA adenosine(34) deaminase TadA [bacterium]
MILVTQDHTTWMRQALAEAARARDKGEVPIGAVVVQDERIVGRGHNLVETLQDPTAHAEMLALASASATLASWRLSDSVLYTTLEPCPMCAGAILMARIPLVVFAATDPRYGACGSALQVLGTKRLDIEATCVSGILAEESQQMLQEFFQMLRQKQAH